jgi:ribosomal protein S27AE
MFRIKEIGDTAKYLLNSLENGLARELRRLYQIRGGKVDEDRNACIRVGCTVSCHKDICQEFNLT